eukprot:9303777-Pyramimonas_sp.AAC.1
MSRRSDEKNLIGQIKSAVHPLLEWIHYGSRVLRPRHRATGHELGGGGPRRVLTGPPAAPEPPSASITDKLFPPLTPDV